MGLVSEGFLNDSPERFPLVMHGLSCDLPNRQEHKGGEGGGLTVLSFLGIIPLLDILSRDLKEKWFSLCLKTRIYLSYLPKRSLVDHSLAMYYPISLDNTSYLSTSPILVVILGWDLGWS